MTELAASVVIPTYNRAALVTRAVASALAATADGDEVIVVDDASTDGTAKMLAPYAERVRYLPVTRGGAGRARNAGIRAARNPLVAFLDSDDEWFSDKLRLQKVLMLARPDILYCFSDFGVRLAGGVEERRYLRRWHGDSRSWDEILAPGAPFSTLTTLPPGREDFSVHIGDMYLAEMERPYIATITLVVRREGAGEALRFAEDVGTFEDWECFGRLAGVGPGAYLDCETAWQWGHAGPRLTDANAFERATAELTILPRVWGADPVFLSRHGEQYRRKVESQHLLRAGCLIAEGKTREARLEVAKTTDAPRAYRWLAALPGPVASRILALRRLLRGKR